MTENIKTCPDVQCSNVSVTSQLCLGTCDMAPKIKEKCKCHPRIPRTTAVPLRRPCDDLTEVEADNINELLSYSEFRNPDTELVKKRTNLIMDLKEIRDREDQMCGYYEDNIFFPCGPNCCNDGEGCPGQCCDVEAKDPGQFYLDPNVILEEVKDIKEEEPATDIAETTEKLFTATLSLLIILVLSLILLASFKTFRQIKRA
jgi:hypothetical protein